MSLRPAPQCMLANVSAMTKPYMRRAHYEHCENKFRTGCIGPSLNVQAERLAKAWHREEMRFRHDYNDKLLSGLMFMSLAAILLFRFVVCVSILETAGWIAFVFLQVGHCY